MGSARPLKPRVSEHNRTNKLTFRKNQNISLKHWTRYKTISNIFAPAIGSRRTIIAYKELFIFSIKTIKVAH